MALLEILSAILATLLEEAAKVGELLLHIVITSFTVLSRAVPVVLNFVAVTIMLVCKLIAWVASSVKKFAIGLVYVTPVLFTKGFPPLRRRYRTFPENLIQMILGQPCPVS